MNTGFTAGFLARKGYNFIVIYKVNHIPTGFIVIFVYSKIFVKRPTLASAAI